jgi:hypothetical protein
MSHAMIHRMSETRLLSYIEIAKLFDMTVPSARNMVRKRHWSRILSNDGKTVRIHVPVEAIPVAPVLSTDALSDGSSAATPDATSEALAILAKHIEALQAELEPLRATAAQVAALNAALDAARDDASRLREERDAAQAKIEALLPLEGELAALKEAERARATRAATVPTIAHASSSSSFWEQLRRRLVG